METVYLETSLISYLVAERSRDLVIAAHQQITHEWWTRRRLEFHCWISQAVIDEAALGDAEEVEKRMKIIEQIDIVSAKPAAEKLTQKILEKQSIPRKSAQDAVHIGIAAAYEINYVLTWNCKHLANAQIGRRIRSLCDELGLIMPMICTPEELMGVK